MRIILLTALLAAGPLLALCQPAAIEQFFNKYQSYEHVTDVKLQGWVLQLASTFTDEEEASRILEKITQLRILSMEEGNLVSPAEYRRLIKDIHQNAFEQLFTVREGQSDIRFYIREEGDAITDVLLLINGEEDFLLLSLEGLLKFSDLNDLNIDFEGSEHFEKLPDDRSKIPRA